MFADRVNGGGPTHAATSESGPKRCRSNDEALEVESALGGTAGHDADGGESVNRFAALIVGGPFDPRDALRFGPRRNQFDHFAFDVDDVAGPYRHHPAQIIDAKSQKRMRPERPNLNGKAHRDGCRVPS